MRSGQVWSNSEIVHSTKFSKSSSWLLNVLIIFSGLSFIFMWVVEQYLQISLVELLSFAAKDPTWVPEGSEMNPAVGVHYFGDYVLGRAWSIHPDPYHVLLPAYPPISLFLFKPFALLPYGFGVLAYFVVSIGVFASAIFYWLSHLPIYLRLISVNVFAIASFPALVALDRGNQIYLMFGLVAWGFLLWRHKKFVLSGLVIGIAIGFKFYLMPILLPLLILGARKIVIVAGSVSTLGSLVLWQMYPGGALYNVEKFFVEAFSSTNAAGSGAATFQVLSNTVSSAFLQLGSTTIGANETFETYNDLALIRILPLLLWLIASVVVCLQRQIPLVVSLTVVLSISQHISANAFYSGLWAAVAGMLLLTSDLSLRTKSNLQRSIKYDRLLIGAAAITVVTNLIIVPFFDYQIVLEGVTSWTILSTKTLGAVTLVLFELLVIAVALILLNDRAAQNRVQELRNGMQNEIN